VLTTLDVCIGIDDYATVTVARRRILISTFRSEAQELVAALRAAADNLESQHAEAHQDHDRQTTP